MGHSRIVSLATAVALVALLAFASSAAAATTRTVTTTSDSVAGSLRAQIAASSPGDTVMLPASATHYMVTAGEITVANAITITGAGAGASIVDAGGNSRIFHMTSGVGASGTVTISNLTLTGGHTTTGPGGGAVLVDLNSGSVAFNSAALTNNSVNLSMGATCCGGGGAVYSNGKDITLTNSIVTGNTATVSATTGAEQGGGALYNDGNAISLTNTAITGNQVTVTASDHGCCHGGGAVYANGAAGTATLTLTGSNASNNTVTVNGPSTDAASGCCHGGGALYQNSNAGTVVNSSTLNSNTVTVNSGQCCHGGGAVYDDASAIVPLSFTGSTVNSNSATVTGPSSTSGTTHCCSGSGAVSTFIPPAFTSSTFDGNSATVTAGDCCHGGGVANIDTGSNPTTITTSSLTNNTTTITTSGGFGGGGAIMLDSGGGGIGVVGSLLAGNQANFAGAPTNSGGGAVFEDTGAAAVASYTNSTLSGNSTNAVAGAGNPQGGGAIYNAHFNSTTPDTLANATVAGNGAPATGGILLLASGLAPKNSILALNAGGNCAAFTSGSNTSRFVSGGYNLEDAPDSCGLTGTGDQVVPGGSVGLAALAANGGPTLTRALGFLSPAVNGGNPAGCTDPSGAALTTDQRGAPRPAGGRCDIGAFEGQPPLNTALPSLAGSGGFGHQLGCFQGLWTGDGPFVYRFAWLRNGKPIAGATASTYTVQAGDVGSASVACQVTAATPYGQATATSAPIGSGVGKPHDGALHMVRRFKALGRGPAFHSAKRTPKGSTISYTDSLPATTVLTVQRPAAGVRRRGRCVAPPRHGARRGKRCTRYVKVLSISHVDKAGLNRLRFSGRSHGEKLRPGRYRLQLVPKLFGVVGNTLTVSFTIVR